MPNKNKTKVAAACYLNNDHDTLEGEGAAESGGCAPADRHRVVVDALAVGGRRRAGGGVTGDLNQPRVPASPVAIPTKKKMSVTHARCDG